MPMQDSKPNEEIQAAYEHLITGARTGVLLTLRNGHPFGSHVPYLLGADWSCAYLHLSRLALHTQHLLEDSRVSLFIAEPDEPGKNPWRFNASMCREPRASSPSTTNRMSRSNNGIWPSSPSRR